MCGPWFGTDQIHAFQSAPALLHVLENHLKDYSDKTAIVHSLGNNVMLEALRLAKVENKPPPVSTFYAIEAAVWSETLREPTEDIPDYRENTWIGLFRNVLDYRSSGLNIFSAFNNIDDALFKWMVRSDMSKPYTDYTGWFYWFYVHHQIRKPYALEPLLRTPRALGKGIRKHQAGDLAAMGADRLNLSPYIIDVDAKEIYGRMEMEDQHGYFDADPLYKVAPILNKVIN
jgi:hypothetical protein